MVLSLPRCINLRYGIGIATYLRNEKTVLRENGRNAKKKKRTAPIKPRVPTSSGHTDKGVLES
jgi:hypothetical protein